MTTRTVAQPPLFAWWDAPHSRPVMLNGAFIAIVAGPQGLIQCDQVQQQLAAVGISPLGSRIVPRPMDPRTTGPTAWPLPIAPTAMPGQP